MSDPERMAEELAALQGALMSRLLPEAAGARERLEAAIYDGYRFPWRVAECPGVLTPGILDSDAAAMERLVAPFATGDFRVRYRDLVPRRFLRPDDLGWFPRFLATDFQRSFDRSRGRFVYGVPEIQSFPGNYLLKPLMVRHYLSQAGGRFERDLAPQCGADSWEDYLEVLRPVVLGACRPEDVAILELNPMAQKTVVDQLLYAKFFGVRVVDLADLRVDSASGELLCDRAVAWEGDRPVLRDFPAPRALRRVLCRALPEEIEEAVDAGALDGRTIENAFQGSLLRGTAEWVVHPQDFFVVWKAALAGHPEHEHPLVPVDGAILDRIRDLGLEPGDGIVKPASRAGGEGLAGFDGPVTAERLLELAAAVPEGLDAAERARRVWLWQPRYASAVIETPPGSPSPGGRNQEIRFLWLADTPPAGGPVRFRLLAGMTRWALAGRPANARFATVEFTGTHGLAFPPGADVRI